VKTVLELCQPRPDVLTGAVRESDFAADLAQVLTGKAPPEYGDPATFFANTHPTAGLRALLESVCRRLSRTGGEAAAIFRLDTQYGGGKTHALIALSHIARAGASITNAAEFLDPALTPQGPVRVAAFDGENADPTNGRPLGHGLRAHTPWGELAYGLAGVEGFERVRASDQERSAPGADTLRELFGGQPTLILLDELSIYLRKVRGKADAEQLTPFLTSLFKAIESSPGAALVFTLAIGKAGKATDAYADENQWLAQKLDEAASVAARKATLLDPTAEHEVGAVLRRRLFAEIDDAGAAEVVEAFRALWRAQASKLPTPRIKEDWGAELASGYPFHPGLLSVLTDKLSTLSDFQRVRGMLRLLAQTVASLWSARPANTHALHVHHLDPANRRTHDEIVTRLGLGAFDPAIRNDVAAVEGRAALAQELDGRDYSGLPPYGSFVARTILWHTFAFNEDLKGANNAELRHAVLGPGLDIDFIDAARQSFVSQSAYLDDRPGANLRFLTEANLNLIIRRQEQHVDATEARDQLRQRTRDVFDGKTLGLVPFPAGPYEVDDAVGDDRPLLVLIHHDAASVRSEALAVPDLVERIFRTQGSQGAFRQLQNNLVFLVADEHRRDEMRKRMVRRLALEAVRHPDRMRELAQHQQDKVNELYRRSEQELALAIQQCYRHLFFPSRAHRVEGSGLDLAHAAFDVHSASERPGDGQQQVVRALDDNQKLLRADDHPLRPAYVRDHTPLKRGSVTTADLRAEFRKDPRLPMMIGDENFVALVRKGVDEGEYVYQSGDLLYGQGDPPAEIRLDAQSFVFTMAYAKDQGLWPRPQPTSSGPTGGTGAIGEGGPIEGSGPTVIPPTEEPPPGTLTFHAEAPLREGLTRIWEQARQAKVGRLQLVRLRVFEVTDAFRLLSAAGTVTGADKQVTLEAEYETSERSSFRAEFAGLPADAQPLKEFLEPQFRAASETDLKATFTFTFAEGLPLDGDAPEKMTERLTRFASGAAFVEAHAEAAP
jgi:hypothetical protein